MNVRALAAAAALVLGAFAGASPAFAQQAPGGPAPGSVPVVPAEMPEMPVPKTDETPETTNLVAEKKPPETNWSPRCQSSPAGEIVDCRVTQNIELTKTGHRLLSVVVRIPRETGSPVMMFNLPHGLYLPAGTTLQIDRTDPKAIVIETCDVKGCYASVNVDEVLLAALKQGSTLTVTFQNLARQPIAVPVTLVGFTAAFAKIQ